MNRKYKILWFSDHALSSSGVGIQSRLLTSGLLRTGKYKFQQLGAAIKHSNYDIKRVGCDDGSNAWNPDDWIIKPIDGFGNKELVRYLLATERPDAIFLFTDPRFFNHIFEIEDEIHQICPIVWWHVWDNYPYPDYNNYIYEATDKLNCHSYMTYEMYRDNLPHDKIGYIPHAVPDDLYFPLSEEQIKQSRLALLGEHRKDHFIGLWVGRNAKRKRPSDLLESWKLFLDNLESKHGHRKATLLMHTSPVDPHAGGTNLIKVVEHFKITDNVVFSKDRIEFGQMNTLYNMADFYTSISYHEGFGVPLNEAMRTATPLIAVKTGGQTRQVVDHRDGSHNGIALDVENRTLVGSEIVPYIYEDYVSSKTVSEAFMKMYEMGDAERKRLGRKALDYANYEFRLEDVVDRWDKSLEEVILNFKNKKSIRFSEWSCEKV